jgi:crossover junction endodeoxyribonuclease RusA
MVHAISVPASGLCVFVPGSPAAQGSKAYKGHRVNRRTGRSVAVLTEQSKAVGPWRDLVAATARSAWGVAPLLDVPLSVAAVFVLPRPVRTPKNRTPAAVKQHHDLDKMLRAIFDALTGAVIRDDCLIVEVRATKRLAEVGEAPGCWIRVGAA